MQNKITDHEAERASNAIRNLRTIASNAKKNKRIEAVQVSEIIITCIDMFRKYCYVNGAGAPLSDTYTQFKHDNNTFRVFVSAREALPNLLTLLAKDQQGKMKEEYRQVELLLVDIVLYLQSKIGGLENHAKS